MNIFQKVSLINKITKAIKKSKKIVDAKKGIAEDVKKHLDVICGEVQELLRLLPDFRNVYFEVVEIIEHIK